MSKRASRRALYGWLFYAPPVLIIAGVLGFDAHLNIETRRNDYEVAKLKHHANALNDKLESTRGRSAATQQLQKLQEQALALGLRDPEPWQIERVAMPADLKPASEFVVARVIPQPPAMPKHELPATQPRPELPAMSLPIPVQEPAAPAEPEVPADAGVMAAAAGGAIELPLMESMPEHVAQLVPVESAAEKPAGHESERAPLAPKPEEDAAPAPAAQPDSLDESVESMLAL